MKIAYLNHSVYNPGGMERTLYNKVRYLSQLPGWEVAVVTTDQHGRPPFYPFPDRVRMTDLGINYSDDNDKPLPLKIIGYLRRRRKHKRLLAEWLDREKPDIVVSLFPSESSFLPSLRDGSKKVLELHYCKYFRLQYGEKGLRGLINRWRMRQDERIVRRFHRFVVLTHEDRGYWGDTGNIEVIPNAVCSLGPVPSAPSGTPKNRVIAVGRLDYQKGFDRLIEAWRIVQRDPRLRHWRLDIFGQGEWRDMLQGMIDGYGLADTAAINPPTKDIAAEYARSSLLAMTSHYEGFPMVMIEAMAHGVPVVTMDYKCGPRDIITPDVDGVIVAEGDIEAFAGALHEAMLHPEKIEAMSQQARAVRERYSEEAVMQRWLKLFDQIQE